MPAGCALMLGNGSDELISLLAMACDVPGASVLAPVPGFVMYEMSAKLQGLGFVGVPLTADFQLDAPAMLAAVSEHRPALTFIAYPNNPTANLWDDAAIFVPARDDRARLRVRTSARISSKRRLSMTGRKFSIGTLSLLP